MGGKEVLIVVLIATSVSLVVCGGVIAYGMRNPLPLIDTAATRAVFVQRTAESAATMKTG